MRFFFGHQKLISPQLGPRLVLIPPGQSAVWPGEVTNDPIKLFEGKNQGQVFRPGEPPAQPRGPAPRRSGTKNVLRRLLWVLPVPRAGATPGDQAIRERIRLTTPKPHAPRMAGGPKPFPRGPPFRSGRSCMRRSSRTAFRWERQYLLAGGRGPPNSRVRKTDRWLSEFTYVVLQKARLGQGPHGQPNLQPHRSAATIPDNVRLGDPDLSGR